MNILDDNGYIITLTEDADDFVERGGYAFGRRVNENSLEISDFCDFSKLGIFGKKDRLFMPRKLTNGFVRLCDEKGFCPVHIHTHEFMHDRDYTLTFSPIDYKFIDRFLSYASKFSSIRYCYFIVTDGVNVSMCVSDLQEKKKEIFDNVKLISV